MTQAQTDANRTNATKSTGPTSPTGKSRASLNSLKHGLSAKHVVLPDESETDYQFLLDGYIDQFQPENPVEFELVTIMAATHWRLRRLLNIETGVLFNKLEDARETMDDHRTDMTDDDRLAWVYSSLANHSQSVSMLIRYEGTLTRTYDRAYRQLATLRSPKKSPATKRSQFSALTPPPTPAEPTI
jgi:hypothetical protein